MDLVPVKDSEIEADPHITEVQRRHLLTEKKTVEDFYRAQSYQVLGSEEDRVVVPIWIDRGVNSEWKGWLKYGIKEINTAAPGLLLKITRYKVEAKIHVYKDEDPNKVQTQGNIIVSESPVKMYLGDHCKEKQRAATCELLQALGFKHQQQQSDADMSAQTSTESNQALANKHIAGISPLDPFTIMTDFEEKSKYIQMSELDKVGLNLLYRPCTGPHYKPKVSLKTGMIYCGREVMKDHNHPAKSLVTSARCGPETSANCPACRTINTTKVQELREMGKWQGWSGLVYCKKEFKREGRTHDGVCGPNNGPTCPECKELIKMEQKD